MFNNQIHLCCWKNGRARRRRGANRIFCVQSIDLLEGVYPPVNYHSHNYVKSHLFMGKFTLYTWHTWPFSMAMVNYQRVNWDDLSGVIHSDGKWGDRKTSPNSLHSGACGAGQREHQWP